MGESRNLVWLTGAAALVLAATISIIAQTPAGAGKAAAPKAAPGKAPAAAKGKAGIPRTPWGDPDLQGTWFVTEDVPLERSAANAGREFLTDAEVEEANARKGLAPGRNARTGGEDDVSGAYNAVFNSVLKTGKRTSRVIDPPNGRIPPLLNPPQARGGGGAGGGGGGGLGLGTALEQVSNPETVAQSSRCLGVTMPFLPLNTLFAQGTVMQVVQSPKTVGIYMEDDHAGGGNRVIYLEGKHPPANIRYYLGDSRGHWEGNTLVVETTNYSQTYRGANPETYKTIERFTRVDADNLRREITFEDPRTWTRPWTVLIEMGKTDDGRHMIFDSACHEGNHGMTGILAGARRQEAAAKQAGKQ